MDMQSYLSFSGTTQSEFARLIGVPPALLHQWAKGKRQVPSERCPQIEKATNGAVTCEELRPDLAEHWAYLRSSKVPA